MSQATLGASEIKTLADLRTRMGEIPRRSSIGLLPISISTISGLVRADGMIRIAPGLDRIPDVSFISWNRLPSGEAPREPISDLLPDFAIEVLTEGIAAGP